MNRLVLYFMTVAAFVACSTPKSIRVYNDLFFDNVKGRVEEIKETPYQVDRNGTIGAADSCCVRILAYDRKGYRTLDVSEDAAGNGRAGQVYTSRYKNGKPKEIQFMANGKVVSTLVGTLRKDGHFDTARIYDETGGLLSFYAAVEANNYGKIIYMKSYQPDGTLQQIIVNKYREQIWVGGSLKDSSGKELFSTVIEPDANLYPLTVVETQLLNGHPSVTRTRYVYDSFDEHGNWIRRWEQDEKGQVRKLVKRTIRYRKG